MTTAGTLPEFMPGLFLRSGLVQTVIGSLKIRLPKTSPMLSAQKEMLLNAGKGIRLQGFYSKQLGKSRGLVILMHGWEGSALSTYIQRSGNFFYAQGFDIFRLNLRDHGDTHHLNPEPFNGSLIDETYAAVKQAAKLAGKLPVYLAGFSLGGNFVLRIALRSSAAATQNKIPNLKHCVAVSPALNPHDATVLMDQHSLLGKYFLQKWSRSLTKKQQAFPEKYNFSDLLKLHDVMDLTEKIIPHHTHFASVRAYFDSYTLLGDALYKIKVPTTIITSKDDPIIRVADFHNLRLSKQTRLIVTNYGGHNGFIQSWRMDPWYQKIMQIAFA